MKNSKITKEIASILRSYFRNLSKNLDSEQFKSSFEGKSVISVNYTKRSIVLAIDDVEGFYYDRIKEILSKDD